MNNLTKSLLSIVGAAVFMIAKLTLVVLAVAYLLVLIIINVISFSSNQANYRRNSSYSKENAKFIAINEGISVANIPIGNINFPYLIKPQQASFIAYDANGSVVNEAFTETIRSAVYDHDKRLVYYESLNGFSVFDYDKWKIIKTINYPYDEHYSVDKMGVRSIVDRLLIHKGRIYFSQAQDAKNNAAYRLCLAETKKCYNFNEWPNHLASTPAGIVVASGKMFWLLDDNLNLLKQESIAAGAQVYGVIPDGQSYRLVVNRRIGNLPCVVLDDQLADQYKNDSSIWTKLNFITHDKRVYMIASKKSDGQEARALTALYAADIVEADHTRFELVWKQEAVYHNFKAVMADDKKLLFEIRRWGDDSETKRSFVTYEFAKRQVQENTISFNSIKQQPIGDKIWMID